MKLKEYIDEETNHPKGSLGEITERIKRFLKSEKFPIEYIDELTEIILASTHYEYMQMLAPKLVKKIKTFRG